MCLSHLLSPQWRVSGWSGGRGRGAASPVTAARSRGSGAAARPCTAGPSARVFTRRAESAPTHLAAVRTTNPCWMAVYWLWTPEWAYLPFFLLLPTFQEGVTGAAGTTGASAAKPATLAGSGASGCARPRASRDTPVMAPERRSAPAMRRSALVSDSFVIVLFFVFWVFFLCFHCLSFTSLLVLFLSSSFSCLLLYPTNSIAADDWRQRCALISARLLWSRRESKDTSMFC